MPDPEVALCPKHFNCQAEGNIRKSMVCSAVCVCVCVSTLGGVGGGGCRACGPDVCRMAGGKVAVMYVHFSHHEPSPPDINIQL
jgi:hypothetical protein